MNSNENDNPDRKYKRYDEAFKRQAVEHWMLSGKSARIIAGELGLNVQSLQKWKQQFKALPAGHLRGWCIIPTGACNTPAPPTGSGWLWLG